MIRASKYFEESLVLEQQVNNLLRDGGKWKMHLEEVIVTQKDEEGRIRACQGK